MIEVDYSPTLFEYAFGVPPVKGTIRSCPEDFLVDEILGFTAEGVGEHFLVHLRKKNTNTDWLARQLAKFVEIKPMDVSYAGLKDRNAITTQWFSVRIPGLGEPEWERFSTEDYQVISATRHSRKLRRGSLKGNMFSLVVRDVQGDFSTLEQRLSEIKQDGVPNYFGEQRFGREGDNLKMVGKMFVEGLRIKNRQKRSLYISAARSFLFNVVCSERIKNNNWQAGMDGEAMMLAGSHSFFVAEKIDADIKSRLAQNDILPTGPLWGRGELPCTAECRIFEHDLLQAYPEWLSGLEQIGLKQERRALCVKPTDFSWQLDEQQNTLNLQFTLPPGSYATSVLREIVDY